ncbi:MAG: ChpI protein [Planctomycetota bacterium]
MKTVISLPDNVFKTADKLAAKLKVSRSQLYVMALEQFIRDNQETDITKRLNEFVEQHGQPIDPVFLDASMVDLRMVPW